MKLGLKKMIWVLCCIVPMMFTMSACAENEEAQEEVVIAEPRVYLDGYEVVLEDTSITTADGKTLSLGADETYTPVAVTKEQLEERIAELKEKYPDFSDSDLAALLVANASYMEPEVFAEYVETYFVDSYHLMMACEDYQILKYNRSLENAKGCYTYGDYSSLIKLDELFFDEYLVAQAVVMEEYVSKAIDSLDNNVEDFNMFIFLYDYILYNKIDELIFMRGDSRVEGTGLIFVEYIIDPLFSCYLYYYYGCSDMEQPELDKYRADASTVIWGDIETIGNRRYVFLVSLERLIIDEVAYILNEVIDTENTSDEDIVGDS